ncbi:MAG TPA: two-component regulator propeller domain-containing protein [Gemmatimonadaceae bacterium]
MNERTVRKVAMVVASAPGLLLAVALAPTVPLAQQRSPLVQHFSTQDGLAQNWVWSVAQDSTGFIFVATKRGLQRFDGHTFVPYAALDPDSPPELRSEIGRVKVDRSGRLWIGVTTALLRRDAPGQWVRFPLREEITGWHEDAEGRVWYSDINAVRVIEPDGEALFEQAIYSDPAGRQRLRSSALGRDGALWLLAELGDTIAVQRRASLQGPSSTYRVPAAFRPEEIRVDERGWVWASGAGGLAVLRPADSAFRLLPVFRGDTVTIVADDAGGQFALGTHSIAQLDSTGTLIEQWAPPNLFDGTPLFQRMTLDREGGLWLPSLTRGLFRVDLRGPLFEHVSRRTSPQAGLASDFAIALLEDRNEVLWIGTLRGGVTTIAPDGSSRTYRHVPGDATSLASDDVWDVHEDRSGRIWIATNGGLCEARARGRFFCRRPPEGPGVISGIAEDDEGLIWVTDYQHGIRTFDPARGTFGPATPSPHLIGYIGIHLDPETGELWIGTTSGGPLRARVAGGRVTEVPRPARAARMPNDGAFDFHRDAGGTTWVASDAGLERWDPTGDSLIALRVPSLDRTTVFSIEEGDDGQHWLGTAHGLVRYDPRSGTARRFGALDGVQPGEFNRGAALRRRSGELIFGGVEGITRFRPADVAARTNPSPIVVTRWRKLTSTGTQEMPASEPLVMQPGDGAFTIEFAALTFTAPSMRRYQYRLDGLDPEWIETADPRATYGAPPPGRYVFRVQSLGTLPGVSTTASAELAVRVIPPVWGTLWFRIALTMLFGAGLWLLHQARLRAAVATERLRLRISRDLHDEVGSGLSSLALLSDQIAVSPQLGERERGLLERIGQSARGMVAELREIVWALDPGNDRLDDVVAHMRDSAGALLPDIRVSFRAPPGNALSARLAMTARRELLLLYKELLHNISRHASARTVSITIDVSRRELTLTVADDGRGFDAADVRRGTGLRSVRERAERVGARFSLSSEPGRGTTAHLAVRLT